MKKGKAVRQRGNAPRVGRKEGKGKRSGPGLRRPKATFLGYAVKFRPPAIVLSEKEYLIPLVHRNKAALRAVARVLDGSAFYVKVADPRPQSILDGHMVMAKFKRAPATE